MDTSGIASPSADRVVRDGLAAADRHRRLREAQQQIWRIAPALAVVALILAALVRWAGWPRLTPMVALAAGTLALTAYAWFARRRMPVSDAAAAAVDRAAGMAGELRSAGWFAAREVRDDWAELHIRRAAERVQDMNWSELYPAIRARRVKATTAAIAVAAALLAVTAPEYAKVRAAASPPKADRALGGVPDGQPLVLTPELQAQLEALLAAAERGDAAAAALSSSEQLRDLLNKVSGLRDAELLEALARAVAESRGENESALENMDALAERARQAAESASLSPAMQDALQKLADELEIAEPELARSQDPADGASGPQQAGDGQSDGAGGQQDVSIQFARDAAAGDGASVLMMSAQSGDQGTGAPGGGAGGSGGQDASAPSPGIEAALKQELVEASQDNPGSNVETEIRRKTEHGNANLAFTGSAAVAFDRSRAAAPPPVPEARRTNVQTYFVRPPQ